MWRPDEGLLCYAGAEDDQDSDDVGDDGDDSEDVDEDVGDADDAALQAEWGSDGDVAAVPEAPAVRRGLPARFRAARSDVSVGSISRSIETAFGLPADSVALRGPDKRVLRVDATIRTLRKRWE
jgi:hypothetical protein